MDLSCKRCGESIPAGDVNLDEMVAKCVACDAVFDMRDQVSGKVQPREKVSLPDGMRVQRVDDDAPGAGPYRSANARVDLTIEWRWFRKKHLFVVAFTGLWWLFLVFWYAIAVAADAPLIMKLFPIVHIVAGLAMAYVCLALFKNTTRLTLEGDSLRLTHQPLRWPGAKNLPVMRIEQLYCTEGVAYTVNSRPVPGYNLHVSLRGGQSVELVKNLPDAAQALYLEQELERCLGIIDRPVPGELPH